MGIGDPSDVRNVSAKKRYTLILLSIVARVRARARRHRHHHRDQLSQDRGAATEMTLRPRIGEMISLLKPIDVRIAEEGER